jgi:hypothetical protein
MLYFFGVGLRPQSPLQFAGQPSARVSQIIVSSCLSHMTAGTA